LALAVLQVKSNPVDASWDTIPFVNIIEIMEITRSRPFFSKDIHIVYKLLLKHGGIQKQPKCLIGEIILRRITCCCHLVVLYSCTFVQLEIFLALAAWTWLQPAFLPSLSLSFLFCFLFLGHTLVK